MSHRHRHCHTGSPGRSHPEDQRLLSQATALPGARRVRSHHGPDQAELAAHTQRGRVRRWWRATDRAVEWTTPAGHWHGEPKRQLSADGREAATCRHAAAEVALLGHVDARPRAARADGPLPAALLHRRRREAHHQRQHQHSTTTTTTTNATRGSQCRRTTKQQQQQQQTSGGHQRPAEQEASTGRGHDGRERAERAERDIRASGCSAQAAGGHLLAQDAQVSPHAVLRQVQGVGAATRQAAPAQRHPLHGVLGVGARVAPQGRAGQVRERPAGRARVLGRDGARHGLGQRRLRAPLRRARSPQRLHTQGWPNGARRPQGHGHHAPRAEGGLLLQEDGAAHRQQQQQQSERRHQRRPGDRQQQRQRQPKTTGAQSQGDQNSQVQVQALGQGLSRIARQVAQFTKGQIRSNATLIINKKEQQQQLALFLLSKFIVSSCKSSANMYLLFVCN